MVVYSGRWGTGADLGQIQGSLKSLFVSVAFYNSVTLSLFHHCSLFESVTQVRVKKKKKANGLLLTRQGYLISIHLEHMHLIPAIVHYMANIVSSQFMSVYSVSSCLALRGCFLLRYRGCWVIIVLNLFWGHKK